MKGLKKSGRGSYRSLEPLKARLESLRGQGAYSVNLDQDDYNQLETNGVFLIHYNIGFFGWRYAVGRLEIRPVNPRLDHPPQSGNIDSTRQEETRTRVEEKLRILRDPARTKREKHGD